MYRASQTRWRCSFASSPKAARWTRKACRPRPRFTCPGRDLQEQRLAVDSRRRGSRCTSLQTAGDCTRCCSDVVGEFMYKPSASTTTAETRSALVVDTLSHLRRAEQNCSVRDLPGLRARRWSDQVRPPSPAIQNSATQRFRYWGPAGRLRRWLHARCCRSGVRRGRTSLRATCCRCSIGWSTNRW